MARNLVGIGCLVLAISAGPAFSGPIISTSKAAWIAAGGVPAQGLLGWEYGYFLKSGYDAGSPSTYYTPGDTVIFTTGDGAGPLVDMEASGGGWRGDASIGWGGVSININGGNPGFFDNDTTNQTGVPAVWRYTYTGNPIVAIVRGYGTREFTPNIGDGTRVSFYHNGAYLPDETFRVPETLAPFAHVAFEFQIPLDPNDTIDMALDQYVHCGIGYDSTSVHMEIEFVQLQVPEPTTMAVMGLTGVAALLRRRRRC